MIVCTPARGWHEVTRAESGAVRDRDLSLSDALRLLPDDWRADALRAHQRAEAQAEVVASRWIERRLRFRRELRDAL